jgi:hypothetical protein
MRPQKPQKPQKPHYELIKIQINSFLVRLSPLSASLTMKGRHSREALQTVERRCNIQERERSTPVKAVGSAKLYLESTMVVLDITGQALTTTCVGSAGSLRETA